MMLGCFVTLPANLDVVLGRPLRFLLERVEYINCLLKLGDIENTIGIVNMNANFIDAGTDGENRLEVPLVLVPVGPLATLSRPCAALLAENAAHRRATSRPIRGVCHPCLTCQIGYTRVLPCCQSRNSQA